ncbi:hypothetical protein [Pseudonocardia sp. NPDC049635]|uniref:hypothetical protein n=1 Tax=Pseudonocardia sp. NPDC049635 TaxID=3155506 RepID=UPI0033FC6428
MIDADPTPDQPTDRADPPTGDQARPQPAGPEPEPVPTDVKEPEQHEPDHDPQAEQNTTDKPTDRPDPQTDPQPTATIHPIRKDTPMTGANPNLTSGETLDPGSAHHFCEQMQNVGGRLLTEIEQSVSSLSQAGVTGEPIRLLEQMRENASLFANSAGEAKTHFARHLNTQDQVLSDDTLAGTVNGTYIGTRT